MSTNKLLQSLSEDPQLEKQIGCMAGILQLFDRHQVLTGRRLYGHKRIAAAASKPQTPSVSNCGSPCSDSSGILSENVLRSSSEEQRQKHAPATGVAASLEQHKNQPPQMPTTPTEAKSNLAFVKTPSLTANEASATDVYSRDQVPKISFDIARSSLLAPRRLDSSRSLHEARINVTHESKVYARKSVDTAERAAAAARGALKELSRITTDFSGPNDHEDQVSIRDIVRSSLGQDHKQAPRSSANPLLSSSTTGACTHPALPHRMASGEVSTCTTRASFPKDMSRAHIVESRNSSECHPLQASNASMPQAGGRAEASRPPRHSKPKAETPPKTCADISESLRLLAKLREASPTYSTILGKEGAEAAHGSKNLSGAHHVPQQARTSLVDPAREGPTIPSRASLPRVASDQVPGRMSSYEPSRVSSVDSLLQGGPKARECPRLSLDGRGAGAGIKADRDTGGQGKLHPRTLLNSRSVSCSNSDCDTESLHEKRTSFSSNVVAKLMGLDALPNEELPQAHPKLGLSGSSDQKIMRVSGNTVKQDVNPTFIDVNPTFSQCGKYVSASFFPSKRRDNIKVPIDSEEEEEDGYLDLEPLSQQEARTLNVRVGSLKLQAGDRQVTSENANQLGHPCYQPKNHHLMEDRPPHVLSPAARLCAQIEAMQRADSVFKDFDRGTRTVGLQQSSNPELEALKQLLGAIHPKKDHTKSYVEKLPMWELPRKPQPESAQTPFLYEPHQQAEQPLAVTWKTKRMLNDDFDPQIHENNISGRRIGMESHNRRTRNGIYEEASHPSSRQYKLPENYNQSPRVRADAYISPGSSDSSMYNTPRKGTVSSISPGGTRNLQTPHARRSVVHPHTPLNGPSTRLSTPLRTSSNQQPRPSSNGSCSWEASSVSSTSSNNIRDHYISGNSNYHTTNKQNKQSERGASKKKTGILKDKEESKANLVSLKPSPTTLTEKTAKSGGVPVTAKSDSRRTRKPAQPQNADNLRSRMGTPTKSSARKAVDVKRKLNFSNRAAPNGQQPSESSEIEDQEVEFVDKTIVSSIINTQVSNSPVEIHEAGHDVMDQDSCMPVENDLGCFVDTPTSINHVRTEGGVKSPLLLLAGADGGAGTPERQATSALFDRDGGEASSPIRTPKGALRLPQVLQQQENEDTESQGDKSTGSCEQPSPISVLEGPFYEDDIASPPTTTKFVLKLEELEEQARGKAGAASSVQHTSPLLIHGGSTHNVPLTDFDYVKHLVQVSCSPKSEGITGVWKLRPLDSHYFMQQLEEEVASIHGQNAACNSEPGSITCRRRMLFDSVNASLEKRLHAWRLCQHQPWLLACERSILGTIASACSVALQQGIVGVDEENNVCLSNEGGKVLLEEVWEEIEANNAKQRGMSSKMCIQQGDVGSMGTSACEGEEEEGGAFDYVGHMLEEDLLGHRSQSGRPDAWAGLLVEKGELGLDLERLIFKDLIDYTIRDLGLRLHPSPSLSSKRQLFKLHN